jgi:hypothetical protein
MGAPDAYQRVFDRDDTDLWDLYVLGRMVDILIAPYQPVNDDPQLIAWTTGAPWWSGPLPSPSVWPAFCASIGASAVAEDRFHPFFHEIVGVQPADDPDEEPRLVSVHWDGAIIGALLIARAGVTVRAGRNRMDPDVAARSPLYWTWYRRNRMVSDLSHGWGHNSQWRTDFRRDYVLPGELHYNVDGRGRLNRGDKYEEMSPDVRGQLVRYRHTLVRDLGRDLWPWDDWLVEHRP